ncbi:leucine-rich repeat domain-containing protein [Kordia sp.]|uniref:leucine-rich repeat domain-containing protein n=1 Tax=Kordia sp. TaxID=1965332 RepID=UPI003D2A2593
MKLKLLFPLLIFTNIIWVLTAVAQPSNDNFANAIPISCGNNYTSSTADATLDENDAPDGFGADLDAPNIWYSYTGAGIPEVITLDLCASGYDTSYLVYTGTSGNLTLVAANDDNSGQCGPGYRSYGTFESDGTTTYYITITGYGSSDVGSVDMNISCIPQDAVFVTDANFEQALIDLGHDSGSVNGYILGAAVDQVNDLNISNKNISDLTGIEAFTSLQILNCSNNNLTSLNLISNTNLTILNCSSNALQYLVLENQTNLTSLDCNTNELEFLSVKNGNNTNVTFFNALNNLNLACIQVDNEAYSTANWTNIGAGANFSQMCTSVTYVPDDNFEQGLIDLGYDTVLDDYVLTNNINTITVLTISNRQIADLTGIDDFTALEELNCTGNNLTSLDLSQNAALRDLKCYFNELTSINLTQNTALERLECFTNNLTTIDLTQNTVLDYMRAELNPLVALDLSQNVILDYINLRGTQLTTLDFTPNVAIETIVLSDNNLLTSIDISQNVNLRNLLVSGNSLTSLNTSQNTALLQLNCNDNAIEYLDLSNNTQLVSLEATNNALTSVDLRSGNNTILPSFIGNSFDLTGNPDLSCVDVDDVAYSTTNWTNIDAGLTFSVNCNPAPIPSNDECVDAISVPISDATCNNTVAGTLTQATNSNSLQCAGPSTAFSDVWYSFVATQTTHNIKILNTSGVDSRVFHAVIDAQTYNCGNITDAIYCTDALEDQAFGLTIGNTYYIQVYTNIENATETFDVCVASNEIPGLTYVPDDNFEQALIDLGYDITLDNYVTTTNIDAIEILNIDSRNIGNLTGIEDFTALEQLYVGNNPLGNLNLTQNPALVLLNANNTSLSTIDLTQNIALQYLSIESNQLTTIDITQNTALITGSFQSNQLATIDVSQNTLLETLNVVLNPQFFEVDVSVNSSLKTLNMNFTQVQSIDVSNNPNLESLLCANCPLEAIDVSANPTLKILSVGGTQVPFVDVSNNPVFENLFVNNCFQLNGINIQNGNNTSVTTFLASNVPNLTCIQVDDVAYSTANWTNVDVGTNFSMDCGFLENDECVNAINIPISNATCNNVIATTIVGATDSNSLQCFGNNANFADVWFSFVATETTHKIALQNLTGSPNFLWHALIDAQTYNCGNITDAIYCADALEGEATELTIGNTYYIQVYSHVANANTTFDICVSTNTIPGLTYVPDDNFEQALIDLGYDITLDDYVTTSNINTVNDLNIRDLGIFDLTGIEDFAGLEILNCGLNFLGELDLSNNTNLNYLIADSAALVGLNVQNGNNTNVTTFITLGNVDLFCIQVDDAAYSTTNWTTIENGTSFSTNCGPPENDECTNAITVLISDNACSTTTSGTLLRATDSNSLHCFGDLPDFTDVWFSFVATETTHNIALLNTTGPSNTVFHAVIDAQAYNCGNITDAIYCADELQSQATDLTIGNTYYIQVYSDLADSTETFDLCVSTLNISGLTYVPDDNFEQALIDLGYDDVLDDYVLTGSISNITELNIANKSISDLTGIEDFIALESLGCWFNQLTSIDLSQNTSLTSLQLEGNQLTSIDLSQNINLTYLRLRTNQLTSIDLTNNINLTDLSLGINQLTTVDVSQNVDLTHLSLSNNQLTNIDLANNIVLENLYLSDNQFTSVDIAGNVNLDILYCEGNQLTTLDVSNNTNITFLNCSNNLLTSLNVGNNTNLDYIDCKNNQLAILDFSINTGLRGLVASDNNLINLNIKNGNNANFLYLFTTVNNPNLECIEVDDVSYSTANWSNIDAGTSFSTDCGFLENDECVDAIDIPISDATCNNVIAATMVGATNSNSLQCFGNNANFTDVWFSFVATETTHKIALQNLTGSPSFLWHSLIDAQTYTCGNITDAIYCTDGLENTATGLTIGNTYYVQVYSHVANANTTFDICVSTNTIPGLTYVPDNNFEQALIDLSLDDVLDDYVTTSNINTVNDLNIRDLGIFDLTGIEDFAALEILNCGLNFLGELDLSQNTNLNYLIADSAALVGLNVQNGNNTNVTTFITLGNVDLFCIQVDDAAYSTANWTLIEPNTSFSEFCGNPIQVAAKAYLQGAMLQNLDGFMRTDLKDNGYILTVSPYTDATAILTTDPVFTATGQDKIVDWVWVELRDATNPTIVIDGKSALLQRDGDIVEALSDNTSTPVSFSQAPGNYYIVIKHRNHLGIMSSSTLALSTTVTTIDFTDRNNQITYGTNAQTNFGMPADVVAMWCGNVNGDTVVQYSGTTPDVPSILSQVLNDAGNFLNFPTYVVSGYDTNDVNMDGNTQYTGTTPDTPFILQNVFAHPGNFLNFSTYQIIEQLPQSE